ncbi:hypothetical protein amb2935 [Paramagnetospirillum magneticum AMB-1]|uniref:Condensation domain-containing protein n=1 Tax=Paramagnetospirillum magneticum (strain ATCC 700264 / AMB-1) TaxID=342108 RepID=Q2W336_PARM1|nr:hypothetical protein amb2935 [Paramagnetospirillum magneticum AMB-1]
MALPVGVINLECLMNRANILFTSGYRFKGDLNLSNIKDAFVAVTERVEKFRHRLHFEAQDNFHWTPASGADTRFHVVSGDDIDHEFNELCRDSLSLVDDGRRCPMALTVIRNAKAPHDFIIAQTSEHTYVDARSAETIFNLIVDYYNALCRGDHAALSKILDAAESIVTLGSHEAANIIAAEGYDRDGNIEGLTAYPVADVGGYAIPLADVPGCLDAYKKQRFAPIVQFFSIGELLKRCRARYPEVTQNSVVCAALAKGFYNLNLRERGAPDSHIISFKMLSDLLKPELRAKYSGNYIAFVPVSVDGHLPIEEMAKSIHDRIRHFKDSKLDLTIFKLTEEAVEAALVGTVDDPLSFVVTNWNNYRFLNSTEYLHGCHSVRHQSGVNIEPKDTLGAILVNRPILVINMSPGQELCLSLFPSLRAEAENRQVAGAIGDVFRQY